jgi:hypothetical protein
MSVASKRAAQTRICAWDQRFFDPILLPDRKPLVTLRDAAEYITELPRAEHDARPMAGRNAGAVAGR